MLQIKEKDIKKIILIGDRVLIQPTRPSQRTQSGLYLPQGMHKKEVLHTGYVLKVGPGYPIPAVQDIDEPWKDKQEDVKYVPLQPQAGDLAVYHQKGALEIEFNQENYVVVSNASIVLLIRDDLME